MPIIFKQIVIRTGKTIAVQVRLQQTLHDRRSLVPISGYQPGAVPDTDKKTHGTNIITKRENRCAA